MSRPASFKGAFIFVQLPVMNTYSERFSDGNTVYMAHWAETHRRWSIGRAGGPTQRCRHEALCMLLS